MSRVIFCPSISRTCGALGLVALTGLFVTGCLGLDSHKRLPDATTDSDPQTCSGISCWKPPQNTCATNGELEVFAPSGYCSGGDCFYATGQETCHAGICDEGVCVSTPCQGVTCIDPPEASCVDADRTIYAPSGYCDGGDCEYASRTSPCEDACAAGACVDSPCAEVFCLKPQAPYCEDASNLVVFAPEGRCAVVDTTAECHYDSQTLACDHGCQGGRCLNDPCAGVHCDTPPARYCDSAMLVLFEPYGVCDEGGSCSYATQRHPCIDPCTDATCGEDDACTWVTCDEPPASYCHDLFVLRVYGREGWCENGYCSYLSSDIDCEDGCQEGRCIGAPCLGMSCDKPPASYCIGEVLVRFGQPGKCEDGGWCSYPKVLKNCLASCKDGACLPVGEWMAKEDYPMPYAAGALTSALLSDGLHVLGGAANYDAATPAERYNNHYVYNLSAQTWSSLPANIPDDFVWGVQAQAYNDKLYLLGGLSYGGTSFRVYDVMTNDWQVLNDLDSGPEYGFVSAVVGEYLYVIGGSDADDVNAICRKYRFENQLWFICEDIPQNQGNGSLVGAAWGDKIYVINGDADGGATILQIYDTVKDSWSQGTGLDAHYEAASAVALEGKIYLFGGAEKQRFFNSGDPVHDTVNIYDTQTDTWFQGTTMPTKRFFSTAQLVENAVHVFGGFLVDENGTTAHEVYYP